MLRWVLLWEVLQFIQCKELTLLASSFLDVGKIGIEEINFTLSGGEMKLSRDELTELSYAVAQDSQREIFIHNYSVASCGGYCDGRCTISTV